MRIAICDDEKAFIDSLKKLLDEYAQKYSLDFVYTEFSSGDIFLLSSIEFDLIFMDYQMKGINGIETVDKLRKRNDKTPVVFVSSYKEMVFESMEVQSHRFLVKPINMEKLQEALDSFMQKYNTEKYVLLYNENEDKMCRVSEKSIIYAEADNIYTNVRTSEASYKYNGTLSNFEQNLQSDFFYRSHRSYLINFCHVISYSHLEIYFDNEEKACLTKTKYTVFQKKYMAFIMRKKRDIL